MDAWMKKLKDRFEKPVKAAYEKLLNLNVNRKEKSKSLTKKDYPLLYQQWCDKFQDIVNGTRGEMPPWRKVNHKIHLIDDNKWHIYHTPPCPLALKEELYEKVN